jgi:hypothetical protein
MSSWAIYIDDSRDGGFYVLAGYVAPADSWGGFFASEWRHVLNSVREPITEFKASDCEQGRGSFRGWSREERTALADQFVEVLTEPHSQLSGLACAVLVPRGRALKLRHAFERLSYSVCLTTLIGESLKVVREVTDCDKLHIYLDEQAKVAQSARLAFKSGQRLYSDGFVGCLCRPEFRKSIETPPLQAADLLAYETLKEIRNRRARPQKPVREALATLTSRRPHVGRFVNLDAAVPSLVEHGERLPGVDDTRLGVIYDHRGIEPNRGRRLDRVDPEE